MNKANTRNNTVLNNQRYFHKNKTTNGIFHYTKTEPYNIKQTSFLAKDKLIIEHTVFSNILHHHRTFNLNRTTLRYSDTTPVTASITKTCPSLSNESNNVKHNSIVEQARLRERALNYDNTSKLRERALRRHHIVIKEIIKEITSRFLRIHDFFETIFQKDNISR